MKKYLYFSLAIFLFVTSFGCRENIVPPDENKDPVIIPLSQRRVLSPPHRAVWYKGKTYEIKWEVSSHINFVRIELDRKEYEKYFIATNIQNNGSYNWLIPQEIPSSHHFKIRIISSVDSLSYTLGDEFEIANSPSR
jgi:hypothetical protein